MQQGEVVEDFELIDQDGGAVRLSDLVEAGPLVLFFFPKAKSPGCTLEGCHFRDLKQEFAELGASIVGVSTDPVDRQKEFDDRVISNRFGVERPGPLPSKRVTFVIDRDRRVAAVIRSEFNMSAHADRALEALREG